MTTVDPAAQSVRVAVALADRFTELLKGPTKVTAARQRGSLLVVSGNETELSMRIHEAQQIYPEIWRHLDDARTAFAARGYDAQTKSVDFNKDGLARAREAARTPGELVGKAYVFSVTEAKLVCAGEIDAKNLAPDAPGSLLGTLRAQDPRDAADTLHREMEVRIRQAIANLHAL